MTASPGIGEAQHNTSSTIASAGIGDLQVTAPGQLHWSHQQAADKELADTWVADTNLCALEDAEVALAYTNETLGKRSAKKGKKVP